MSGFGIIEASSDTTLNIKEDFNTDNNIKNKKIMNVALRCTYYVFYRRNKTWENPIL